MVESNRSIYAPKRLTRKRLYLWYPYHMTGKSHVIVNASLTYALFGSPELSIAAAFCAKLPDQLELFLPGVPHRSVTHIMIFWFAASIIFGAGMLYPSTPLFSWEGGPDVRFILFGVATGGLFHVIADFFSISGVPVLLPGKGIGLKWYTTGTQIELAMLLLIVAVSIGIFAAKTRYRPSNWGALF